LNEYSNEYNPTQSYSATFNVFHRHLAQQLIDRYDLHHKHIIEIGCGQGEFLTLLCELGENQGVGFDPAYVGKGGPGKLRDRLTFIRNFVFHPAGAKPARAPSASSNRPSRGRRPRKPLKRHPTHPALPVPTAHCRATPYCEPLEIIPAIISK
jgi:hypothetical protein